MHPADHQLIKRSLKGDRAANTTLYDRHEAYWFRLCLRYGRDRSEAHDIFQEGVLQVFRSLNKFDRKRGNFSGWSNRVLINAALRYLKQQRWQQSFDPLETATSLVDPAESIIDKITAKELIEVIQQLPLGYRLVFNLYEIEGYRHQEIASMLNISVGTSKSQLFKAKRLLRERLQTLFH